MNDTTRPRRGSIARKVTIALLLCAVVPLVVAVALAASASRAALDDSARRNLALIAQATASRLDQLLADTSRNVAQVARDDDVIAFCSASTGQRPALLPAVDRLFASVTTTSSDFASIFVTDAAGVGIASTSPANVGMDFTFREYVREALLGRRFVSEFLVGKTSGEPGVYFAHPVLAGEGESRVIGAVVLKLRGERIWSIVDHAGVAEGAVPVLIESHGVVLSIPDKSRLYSAVEPLSAAQIASLDPEATFSLPAIAPLGTIGLASAVRGAAQGATLVRWQPATEGPVDWIAGFAAMQERPWRVLIIEPQSQFTASLGRLAGSQAIVAGIVAILAALVAWAVARGIVRPILDVRLAADALASGDMKARAPEATNDEIGDLARAFNAMVPRLEEHVKLAASMAVAVQVQQGLLPDKPPTLPGLDVEGRSKYCDAAGGDYYDFIDMTQTPGGRTLFVVADVMGHGVGSALMMAACRAALRADVADANDLAHLITRVNRVIASDGRAEQFITLAMLEIDPVAGKVRWASGGHDPAIIYRPSDGSFRELDGGGIPVGIDADAQYEQYEWADLRPGDLIVVGTDGIWESASPAGELFGKDRLRDLIQAHADRPLKEIGDQIEASLRTFRDGVPQHDDVTFVLVRVKGPVLAR